MTQSIQPANPIPLTILTGFLGAGKTTLLNRILHSDHGLRLAVLVNDFGSINIDSELVAATSVDGDTISLSNGCICCTIRGDLLQAVENLFKTDTPPEYIILETSGVSDPLEVALTFRDVPAMQRLVTIDSIITVIDAEQFRDVEREHAVLAMNQVGMADIVILNKVDLVTEDELVTVETQINHIMPKSRIYRANHADVPLALLLGVGNYDPQHLLTLHPVDVHVHENGVQHDHHHADHSTVFHTWSWCSEKPLSLNELEHTLKKLPPSVFRLKGFLYTQDKPDQRLILQVVGKRVTVSVGEPWEGVEPYTQLVAIGTAGDLHSDELNRLFTNCLYENAPKHQLERLTRGVLAWLR